MTNSRVSLGSYLFEIFWEGARDKTGIAVDGVERRGK